MNLRELNQKARLAPLELQNVLHNHHDILNITISVDEEIIKLITPLAPQQDSQILNMYSLKKCKGV